MTNSEGGIWGVAMCWLIALIGGVAIAAVLFIYADWLFMQAAFMGTLVLIIAGPALMWLLTGPLPPLGGEAEAATAPTAQAAAPAPVAEPAPAPAPAAEPTPAPAPVAEPAPAADPVEVDIASTQLPGQEELAARKGTWKYEGDAAEETAAPAADPAPEPAPAPAAEVEVAVAQPETLAAARDGGPDDLKLLKGVGPKLEKTLHELGFFHFDQIAAWTEAEVAWVDTRLKFKGRIERDGWIDQAKILAAGGETEFSKRKG